MRLSKNTALISLFLSATLILTGCLGCKSETATDARTKIQMVMAPNFSEWTSTYAIRNNIVTSDKVDIGITFAQDFNTQMTAGNFMMGEMSTATYAMSHINGQKAYKILSGLALNRGTDEAIGTTMLFVPSGSTIKSPADLIGKEVGVPDLQSSSTCTFLSFLKSEYGITQDQLTLVDKSNSILIELLRKGELDAAIIGQNVGTQAYYDSDFKMIWNLDVEFARKYGASCIPTVILVDSGFYNDHSEAVQAVYQLLIESNQYAEEHLAELAQAYTTEYSGLGIDFYLKIHKYHSMAGFARMDAENQASIIGLFQLMHENGVIGVVPDSADIFINW